jgi:hypothetical protein
MALLASDVMDASAALLNDNSRVLYTYTAQLPYLKLAHRDLLAALRLHGISILDEQSGTFTVNANATTLAAPPTDLLDPLELEERAPGETDDYWVPMTRKTWEPSAVKDTILRWWVWRELEIKFLGATTSREVRVKYRKIITDPTGSGSNIVETDALDFLGKQTGKYCAFLLGENPERGALLEKWAEEALNTYLASAVNLTQDDPARPLGYNWRGRQ